MSSEDRDPKDESTFEESGPDGEGFEEESNWKAKMSMKSVMDAACDVQKQMEDAFMTFVPPEVTQHLVNAHKEMIQAGMRLGDIAREKLDEKAQRAQEIHERMKEERERRKADSAE